MTIVSILKGPPETERDSRSKTVQQQICNSYVNQIFQFHPIDIHFSLQASDCETVLWNSDVQKALCLSSVSHGTLVAENVTLTLLASEATLQCLL